MVSGRDRGNLSIKRALLSVQVGERAGGSASRVVSLYGPPVEH